MGDYFAVMARDFGSGDIICFAPDERNLKLLDMNLPRFAAADNDPGDVLECAVDAIEFESFECEQTNDCLADVNGDGAVTPTDFTAWVNAFNNNLPECDQNGDGACTPTDFTAWVNNFNAGCP